MTFTRLIRRAIRSWLSWRADKRLSRAIPSYAHNRARLQQLKRSHKNTQPALKEMRAAMLSALRGQSVSAGDMR